MSIEFNEVSLSGEDYTLSLLAEEGCLTSITGGTAARRTRWLHVLMGFEAPVTGYVCVDGEPLAGGCIAHLRKNIAFAPSDLFTVGCIVPYEPPTADDVLALRRNRRLGLTVADVEAEAARTGATGKKAELLALATLRRKAVVVVDSPMGGSAAYLHSLAAQEGSTVIAATDDSAVIALADKIQLWSDKEILVPSACVIDSCIVSAVMCSDAVEAVALCDVPCARAGLRPA